MSVIQEVLLLAGLVIGGVSGLGAFIATWAHKQNHRNDSHRHHHESL